MIQKEAVWFNIVGYYRQQLYSSAHGLWQKDRKFAQHITRLEVLPYTAHAGRQLAYPGLVDTNT